MVTQTRTRGSETLANVSRAVCDYFGVTEDDLRGRSYKLSVVYPRHVFIYLARELTRFSLEEVGEYVERDYSSIAWACTRIRRRTASDRELAYDIAAIRDEIVGQRAAVAS